MLEEFINNIENKFGELVEQSWFEPTVGDLYDKSKKHYYHEMILTEYRYDEKTATDELIKEINKYLKSVIPINQSYKNYVLFWRVRPKVYHEINFDLDKNIYYGLARLSIAERFD